MKPHPAANRFTHAFRALTHRNYRLFFAGQATSLVGTWIARIAMGWLVLRLTHSAFMLGLVSFTSLAPTFLLTPVGGIIADRYRRLPILLCTQFVLMITSFALAYFAIRGTITVHHAIVLGAIQGLCNAFDIPARQAFVVEMVEGPADLSSAIAMNSMIFNSARLIGPSIAGALISIVDVGPCFLIDGISFIGVLSALLAMRVPKRELKKSHPHVLHDLHEGLDAAFGFKPIRAILLLMALTSLVGMPYTVLMPIFADRVLHGDAMTFGILMAASGIGALAGAMLVAIRRSVVGLGRYIVAGSAVFGIALIVFGLSRTLWISIPALVLVGMATMTQTAASNTVVQTIVDDHKRGRVMGFFAMAFLGTMSVGGFCAGAIARHIGAPATVILGGSLCIVGAIVFGRMLPRLREIVRPIYRERGLLPPLPEGVGSAAGLVSPDDVDEPKATPFPSR